MNPSPTDDVCTDKPEAADALGGVCDGKTG